jgi:hypothetical protein
MAATSTYLTITNNTIDESGAELASFLTNGSDFTSNTNALMQRIRRYVSRAWKDIQMTAYDWDFLAEQAAVNLDPGIMFYTDGTAVSTFAAALANSTINVYDQDGTVAIPNLTVGSFTDLTGTATSTSPFGYFNITGTNLTSPLNVGLKPGAEHFFTSVSLTFDHQFLWTYSLGFGGTVVNNVATYAPTISSANPYKVIATSGNVSWSVGLCGFHPPTGTLQFYYNSADSAVTAAALTDQRTFTMTDPATGGVILSFGPPPAGQTGNNTTGTFTNTYSNGAIAYIHSWKSFDFDEETQIGDFQENIQEINQQSFRIVDYYKAPPSGESPLTFVPWSIFEEQYDLSNATPGFPRVISKDGTARWRLYPAPYYKVTVKFDFTRKPQILSAYTDIPKGIEEEFVDAIMWKALMYYGSYDEQPSVYARAEKNFKDYMFRLELRNREKFHFKPIRLY